MAHRLKGTTKIAWNLGKIGGLGQLEIGDVSSLLGSELNSAIGVGASAGLNIVPDASLTNTATDDIFKQLLTGTGGVAQKELANLNIFGTNIAKEVGLWTQTAQDPKNNVATNILTALGPVAGAVIKQAIPNMPKELSGLIDAFTQSKALRDQVLNMQVGAMQANVQNQLGQATQLQQMIGAAQTPADKEKWAGILQAQQQKVAAARAVRDLTNQRKTSEINATLAKKEQYKNIAIGIGVSAILFGVAYYLSTRRSR